jgi:uncharacterized membrane protein YqhA
MPENNNNDNRRARWLDFGVIARLVVGFFLFAQGASFTRTVLYFTGKKVESFTLRNFQTKS